MPIGGVPALIKQDISTICDELLVRSYYLAFSQTSYTILQVFENALFSCVPVRDLRTAAEISLSHEAPQADLEPVAEKFQDAIDSACSRAILAYYHV